MKRDSLKQHQAERDLHKKETTEATHQLSKTEVDVVRVAEQVGAIQSRLSDVNEMIRAERDRVLDSGAKAGEQDASLVQAEERKAAEHRQSVEGTERDTAAERHKAAGMKPADSRIRDGSAMTKLLEQTGNQLKEIANDLRSAETGAREKRSNAQSRMGETIRKNRR